MARRHLRFSRTAIAGSDPLGSKVGGRVDKDQKLKLIQRTFYRRFDDDYWFRSLSEHVESSSRTLELGAGSGEGLQNQRSPKGMCAFAVGIDLDERVLRNPNYDETRLVSGYALGSEFDYRFDVIHSTMVAEHIDDPVRFVESQLAVLADGGVMIHHTVSKYYYSSLLNLVLSERTKNWLIAKLGSGREPEDVFPAHYRLNSARDLRRLAKHFGLRVRLTRVSAPPGYLRRSIGLMLVYVAVDKLLRALFPAITSNLIFEFDRVDAHACERAG